MVTERNRPDNTKKEAEVLKRRIKAGLAMYGHTIASFARAEGVSRPLISRLINQRRSACRGRSAEIRRKLEELAK